MRSAIFITVRSDSIRLPKKAFIKILGKTVLEHVINRAKLTKEFDEIIVCTTCRRVDDDIKKIAFENNVKVFRGSCEDKLDRWNKAAKKYNVDYVVTFDADDLFCSYKLMDMAARQIAEEKCDFIESPAGLICGAFTYAFTSAALERVCEIKNTSDTEMMWVYFRDSGIFSTASLENVPSYFFNSNYRMTLDYPEDVQFFESIFNHFKCVNNDIPLADIVRYLEQNPEIAKINIQRQQEFLDNQKRKTHLILKEGIKSDG